MRKKLGFVLLVNVVVLLYFFYDVSVGGLIFGKQYAKEYIKPKIKLKPMNGEGTIQEWFEYSQNQNYTSISCNERLNFPIQQITKYGFYSDVFADKICKMENVCFHKKNFSEAIVFVEEKIFEASDPLVKGNVVEFDFYLSLKQYHTEKFGESKNVHWVKKSDHKSFYFRDWTPNVYHTVINTYFALFRTFIALGMIEISLDDIPLLKERFTLFSFGVNTKFFPSIFNDTNVISVESAMKGKDTICFEEIYLGQFTEFQFGHNSRPPYPYKFRRPWQLFRNFLFTAETGKPPRECWKERNKELGKQFQVGIIERKVNRKILNSKELLEALKKEEGVVSAELFDFENMKSTSEQIHKICEKNFLIAADGAGMSHIMWMCPNQVVVVNEYAHNCGGDMDRYLKEDWILDKKQYWGKPWYIWSVRLFHVLKDRTQLYLKALSHVRIGSFSL